jgi:transposase
VRCGGVDWLGLPDPARTSDALADVDRLIKTLLVAAHVLHVDETSTQVARRRHWLHVACTSGLTAFHLHSSRGRVAVDDFGVLPDFTGVAVHDALSVYAARAYQAPYTRCAVPT